MICSILRRPFSDHTEYWVLRPTALINLNRWILMGSVKRDHAEYRVPRSFMCVLERFVSPGPTPAVWPKGGTLLLAGGPCLSPSTKPRIDSASWSALLRLASVRSNEAGRGVTGFGTFCRNKRASPAGAKPGNTGHHFDTRVGYTRARHSPTRTFSLSTPKMDF